MNIKRVIATTALTVVPLTVSSAALAAPAPQGAVVALPVQVSAEGAQHASTVLTKVNELRSRLGLQPVTQYQELDAVAQDWSEQQAGTNNMKHRPDFASSYPAGWTTGSENVAFRDNGGDVGALIFDQWLNSPGHYENMVNPDVNSIGIGFAQTSSGRWYATQNFAAYNPSNTPLTPTVAGTPPSTSNIPTTDISVSAPAPAPSSTPTTPAAEPTPPAEEAPPVTEAATPEATATAASSAPAAAETTTSTDAGTNPSSTTVVAASSTTPTKPSLATTGPSIAVAAVAVGLLGAGIVLVMRRRRIS